MTLTYTSVSSGRPKVAIRTLGIMAEAKPTPPPPPPRSMSQEDEPVRVREYPNFLTQSEIEHFVEQGMAAGMKPALLVGKLNGVDIQDEARTNSSAWLSHSTPM